MLTFGVWARFGSFGCHGSAAGGETGMAVYRGRKVGLSHIPSAARRLGKLVAPGIDLGVAGILWGRSRVDVRLRGVAWRILGENVAQVPDNSLQSGAA